MQFNHLQYIYKIVCQSQILELHYLKKKKKRKEETLHPLAVSPQFTTLSPGQPLAHFVSTVLHIRT